MPCAPLFVGWQRGFAGERFCALWRSRGFQFVECAQEVEMHRWIVKERDAFAIYHGLSPIDAPNSCPNRVPTV